MKAVVWHGKRGVDRLRLPIDEGRRAYSMFQRKKDGAIEIVLQP